MLCPRCGTEMVLDCELDVDGPIYIYVCPNCRETAHKG